MYAMHERHGCHDYRALDKDAPYELITAPLANASSTTGSTHANY